jgi:hypothetical protein
VTDETSIRPTIIGYDESRLENLRDLLMFSPKLANDPALVRGIALNLLDQRDTIKDDTIRSMEGQLRLKNNEIARLEKLLANTTSYRVEL